MDQSERGGILGGLLAGLAVLVCIGIVAVVFVARNVHVTSSARDGAGDVSIDTPAGHLTVHGRSDGDAWPDADVPKYPGAYSSENHGGAAVVQWDGKKETNDLSFSVGAAELITSDPASKVIDFYREQLPTWSVQKDEDGATKFEIKRDGRRQIVGIHERSDGTHIGVASVGEPASN